MVEETVVTSTRCSNSLCTCDPCTCSECACGASSLGDLELRAIQVLWAHPGQELTGRQVADQLPGYAYTTVATVLDRLVHKGLVNRRKVGRRIQFSAAGEPGAHGALLMRQALASEADAASTLALFVRSLSSEQTEALRAVLAESGEPSA